jgi:hypothetical protein
MKEEGSFKLPLEFFLVVGIVLTALVFTEVYAFICKFAPGVFYMTMLAVWMDC